VAARAAVGCIRIVLLQGCLQRAKDRQRRNGPT